jgi:hypothetical protein
VDIILSGDETTRDDYDSNHSGANGSSGRGDILTVLLNGTGRRISSTAHHYDHHDDTNNVASTFTTKNTLVELTEGAHHAALKAAEAKKEGDLHQALEQHTTAARLFQEAALEIGRESQQHHEQYPLQSNKKNNSNFSSSSSVIRMTQSGFTTQPNAGQVGLGNTTNCQVKTVTTGIPLEQGRGYGKRRRWIIISLENGRAKNGWRRREYYW